MCWCTHVYSNSGRAVYVPPAHYRRSAWEFKGSALALRHKRKLKRFGQAPDPCPTDHMRTKGGRGSCTVRAEHMGHGFLSELVFFQSAIALFDNK